MLSTRLLLASCLVVAAVPAVAESHLSGCSYDVHGSHISDIREDHYFQNPFEMTRIDDRHFRGSLELNDGYTLKLNVEIAGGKIRMLSEVSSGDHVAIRLAGAANLPKSGSKGFVLNKSKPTVVDAEEGSETVFQNVGVRCVVAPSFTDKLHDLVTRFQKPAQVKALPSPRRASRQAGVS